MAEIDYINQPWLAPGSEYQGYGNPYAEWWGGGRIPMDDPRRAQAARVLYEQTGRLYTPYGNDPTLTTRIQNYVDDVNQQGRFRLGDQWQTYQFDPTKFIDIPLRGDRGQSIYTPFLDALRADMQSYYQQYVPESTDYTAERISPILMDMYGDYATYQADREEDAQRNAQIQAYADRNGLGFNEAMAQMRARSQAKQAAMQAEREARQLAMREAYDRASGATEQERLEARQRAGGRDEQIVQQPQENQNNVYFYGENNPFNQDLYMTQGQVDSIHNFMNQMGKGGGPTNFTIGETQTGQSGMQYTPVTGKGGQSGYTPINTAPIQQTSDGTNFQAVQGKGGPPQTQGKGGTSAYNGSEPSPADSSSPRTQGKGGSGKGG